MTDAVYSTPEWYRQARDKDAVDSDIKRLTIHHFGFKQAAGGTLVFAPVDFAGEPRAILDVGTADGLWMREVQSSVASPVQCEHRFLGTDINIGFFPKDPPKGIKFVQLNIQDAPPREMQNQFDLINLRMVLIAAGSGEAQRTAVNRHIELLKPGGWIQIGDCDRVCPTSEEENARYHDMFACIRAVCQASGLDPLEAPKMKGWLEEAGLEMVEERTAMRAVGKCNTDDAVLGRLGMEADLKIAKEFAAGAKSLLPSSKPLSDERLDSLVQDLEVELTNTGAYFPMRFIWGRKPI